MAKLHFKYATMNSGKTIDLIRTAHNYEENGYKILVLKPSVDTKGGDLIVTRISSLQRKADFLIKKEDSVLKLLSKNLNNVKCIFVDEAQFLTPKQVDELNIISKASNIPVICYGLRLNFKMEAFPGSKRLLEISDTLEELVTLCSCGNLARFVGRKVNDVYVTDGDEVVIDGTDNVEYVPLCGECYLTKISNINLEKIKEDLE